MNFLTKKKYRQVFVSVIMLATIFFGYHAYKGFASPQPQASLDVQGEAYQLQQRADKLFPQDVHTVRYEIYSPDGSNVLTQSVLLNLLNQSNKLRNSDLGNQYLVNFRHPDFGETTYKGFFTLADAVSEILQRQDESLVTASSSTFRSALDQALTHPRYGNYLRLLTSQKLTQKSGKWHAPAF